MATFVGGAWWPEWRTWTIGAPLLNTTSPYAITVTAARRMGVVVACPHAGTLTGFSVYLGTRTETGLPPSPSIYRFSLRRTDADGLPTGPGPTAEIESTDLPVNTWYTPTMTGTLAVARGERVACTMEFAHEGNNAAAFWIAAMTPHGSRNYLPPWRVQWVPPGPWGTAPPSTGVPCLSLRYSTASLSGPPPGLLPVENGYRTNTPLSTAEAVGMDFTVPRPLACDGVAFHLEPTDGATIQLLEGATVLREASLAASAAHSIWPVSFSSVTLRPGHTYRARVVPVSTITIRGYRAAEDVLADFEGGPTWTAFGDPDEHATRWFFSLRIASTLTEPPALRPPTLSVCPPPFTPPPCDQDCPAEPDVAMTASLLEKIQARRKALLPPRVLPLVVGPSGFRSALWFLGMGGPLLVVPPDLALIPPGATFTSLLCDQACPADPPTAAEACSAPLGEFRLGVHCLGPGDDPTALRQTVRARHQRALATARARRR